MATNTAIKFFKGESFSSYVEGGIYFEKSTGLIKVGRNGGVDSFGGDVKDAVLDGKKLTISFNSGKAAVELDFSDCASATAVAKQISDLDTRVKAIEDDYLKGADKTELNNAITAVDGKVDSLSDLVGTLPEAATATTVVGYVDERAAEIAAKAGVISIDGATAGTYVTVGVDKTQGEVTLTLDESELDAKITGIEGSITDITKKDGAIDTAVAAEAALARAAEEANASAASAAQATANTALANASAAQSDIDALEELIGAVPEGQTVQGEIEALQTAATGYAAKSYEAVVDTLVGEDANKSVRTIANEELAKQLIAENADEALDSLKEIADWIQAHPSEASAMNTAIQANATAISAEEARAMTAESALSGRLDTLEGASYVNTVKASVSGSTYVTVAPTEATSGAVTIAIDATALNTKIGEIEQAIEDAGIENLSATGDELVSATYEDGAFAVAGTTALSEAVTAANSALQSVSASGDDYVSASFGAKSANAQALEVGVSVQGVSTATAEKQGLADAYDVKSYVDSAVNTARLTGVTGDPVVVTVDNDAHTVAASLVWSEFA